MYAIRSYYESTVMFSNHNVRCHFKKGKNCMRRKSTILIFVFWMVSILVMLGGCGTVRTVSNSSDENSLQELAASEITEYEGKDLSSILDFRDNSIEGPQEVAIDEYTLTIDGLVDDPMT